jgi:hypothetical protein
VAWTARPRRILPCITHGPDGRRLAAQLSCSFDGGSTWAPYPGNFSIDHDSFTVWLSDQNLASVKRKVTGGEDTDGLSVWAAIVSGTFRLAVTCGVEGDSLTFVDSDPAQAVTSEEFHAERRLHKDFRYETSEEGNSELAAVTGNVARTLDDSDEALSLANRIVSIQQDRAVAATVVIPYLTDRWRPGDLVLGLDPRGIPFSSGTGRRAAGQVHKVNWITTVDNQLTILVIGDRRMDTKRI